MSRHQSGLLQVFPLEFGKSHSGVVSAHIAADGDENSEEIHV